MQQQFIFELNEENFHSLLEKSQQFPVLFYFWSNRSEHCAALTEDLTQIVTQAAGQIYLVKVDCDKHSHLAAQFGLRAIPTVYLFQHGQPVDGFEGPKTEQDIRLWLEAFLPKEDEIKAQQGQALLQEGKVDEALPLLKQAWHISQQKKSDIAFLLAQAYLVQQQASKAEEVLKQVPLQDQNTEYQSLMAQIELLKQSADTPEIQQLQKEIQENPKDIQSIMKLGLQLHQVGRNEEALALFFDWLQQDLNIDEGKMKKLFMDILSALGTDDPLATEYRRKLYSLLY